MANLLYTNKLRYGSPSAKYAPKVERFQTDSYSIRATVGINSIETSYDLEWSGLTEAEATALVNQLKTAKGVDLLDWQPPLESSALSFTAESWSVNEYPGTSSSKYYSVSATLNREYDN